jgi:hypothetical protein
LISNVKEAGRELENIEVEEAKPSMLDKVLDVLTPGQVAPAPASLKNKIDIK